jgi:hypothetical protein
MAADTQWIAMCEDDERAAFKQGCESRRRSLERRTAHLYALQCKAVELGIMEKVTVEYPERLREQERLEDDVLDKAARLPRHQQHRFSGRALVDLAHDRTFNLLVDRYTRVTTTTRPRARERRPGTARRTSSSSTSSGTDPGEGSSSDDPEPPARQCAASWCAHLIYGPPQQRYCRTERCDRARAEEHQRKHRHGDLTAQERERLEFARRAGMIGEKAFAAAGEHALSFLWKFALVDGSDPGEKEALLNRPACRCNGHHIDGGAGGCFKCGQPRSEVVSCS